MAAFSGEIIGGEKINCKNAAGMQPACTQHSQPVDQGALLSFKMIFEAFPSVNQLLKRCLIKLEAVVLH